MSERPDRVRPKDIRTPVTVEEALAAVSLAESMIERIHDQLEDRANADEDWRERAHGMLEAWSHRLEGLRYWLARLQAGEMPLSIALAQLRAENDLLRERVAGAERAVRVNTPEEISLKQRCAELQRKNNVLVTQLQQAQAALAAKNAERRAATSPVVPVEDSRKMYTRKLWEISLYGESALIHGGEVAASFLRSSAVSVPPKFRTAWNADRLDAGLETARSIEELPMRPVSTGAESKLAAVANELLSDAE